MKTLIKITAMFAAVIMMSALSGCSPEEKAENTFNETMTALQEGDFVKAGLNIADTSVITENPLFNVYKDKSEFTGNIFYRMSYSINSVEKIDDSNVKINAEITNVDMESVFADAIGEVFTLAISNAFAPEDEQMSDEDIQYKLAELIAEGINAEDAKMTTSAVDVNTVKTGTGWKIDVSDDVLDAVTGGLVSIADDIESLE